MVDETTQESERGGQAGICDKKEISRFQGKTGRELGGLFKVRVRELSER